MKTLAIGLSAAVLVLGGSAYAAPGQMKRSADADGNGVVTRAETQAQAAARFARLDHNKDGKLDGADRQARQAERQERRFARLDTDGNGQISKAEFTAERGPRSRAAPADAQAGRDEARPGRRHAGRHHGRHGMTGGRLADANGDKAVSQAEFTTAALARFDAMDGNRDGQVTQQERQTAREQMKAKWQQMRAQKTQG